MASGQGLKFTITEPTLWNRDIFIGVCIANGCLRQIATRVAAELERDGIRKTTVTKSASISSIEFGSKAVGVHLERIPAR